LLPAAPRRPLCVCVPPSPRSLCTPSVGVGSVAWAISTRPGPRRAGAAPGSASLTGGPRGQAAHRVRWAAVVLGPVPILARWPGNFKKFLFYFSFGFKLNSNFKNLYLNI
jgi:hypothetical protein